MYAFNIGMPEDVVDHMFDMIAKSVSVKYAILYPHRTASLKRLQALGTVVHSQARLDRDKKRRKKKKKEKAKKRNRKKNAAEEQEEQEKKTFRKLMRHRKTKNKKKKKKKKKKSMLEE